MVLTSLYIVENKTHFLVISSMYSDVMGSGAGGGGGGVGMVL